MAQEEVGEGKSADGVEEAWSLVGAGDDQGWEVVMGATGELAENRGGGFDENLAGTGEWRGEVVDGVRPVRGVAAGGEKSNEVCGEEVVGGSDDVDV